LVFPSRYRVLFISRMIDHTTVKRRFVLRICDRIVLQLFFFFPETWTSFFGPWAIDLTGSFHGDKGGLVWTIRDLTT
jgi:hypothetical protein